MADRVGQNLGNYHLIRLLGRGGFAEVYLGKHLRLGTQAAVKVLYARLAEKDDVEGFEKEARTIAHLKHPHIVRVLDYDVEEDTPFLVMDYAPGGTLRHRHPKGTRLPLTTIIAYVKEVAAALQYAHDQRIIHRDVKPENLLLGEQNQLLLSDLGIATVAHRTSSQSTQGMAGTLPYMAPEQIRGQPRPASDQYSLGVVVYEWLSGSVPFQGSMTEIVAQHLAASPPSLQELVPGISPAVEQVVLTALEKDPQKRFGSIEAFATALEQSDHAWQAVPPRSFPSGSMPAETLSGSPAIRPFPSHSSTDPAQSLPLRDETFTERRTERAAPENPGNEQLQTPIPGSSRTRSLGRSGSRKLTSTLGIVVICILVVALSVNWIARLQIARAPHSTSSTRAIRTSTPTATPTPLPVGTITEFSLPAPMRNPESIAAGSDGNMWFMSSQIGSITPQGTITAFPLPATSPCSGAAGGITAGPDGNLWYVDSCDNKIGRITPTGTIVEFGVPTSVTFSDIITAGPHGALWFTERNNDKIGRITQAGTVTEFPIQNLATGIAAGPDGNLWFISWFDEAVGRITPSGTVTEFPLPRPPSSVANGTSSTITAGPDGNLWFTEGPINKIGRITPAGKITEFHLPTPGSYPNGITTGPDGNLWFTEFYGNKIGRITTAGTITEFSIPTANSQPWEIATGRDGSLWFTESNSNRIGRIASGR